MVGGFQEPDFSCHAPLVTKRYFGFVNISQVFAQVDLVSIILQMGVDVVKPWNVGIEPSDISLFIFSF